MKHLILSLVILMTFHKCALGQSDTTVTVSDKIKMERDQESNDIKNKLKENELEIKKLQEQLAESKSNQAKITTLDGLQQKLDERIKALESSSKTKAKYNGQLALIELLSVQRDLKPAKLFSSSQTFFSQLGSISNLQNYNSFTQWKTEYEKWYEKQDKEDQMLELIHSSIDLISDVTNKVPLYGSIVQTVSSGVGTLISSLGKKNQALKNKTPEMLRLLNATSQFENQKAIIDHEWEQLNKELAQLQDENDKLLKEQLEYYEIDFNQYETEYLNETLETKRDKFKNACRTAINNKIIEFENTSETSNKWLGQVETYMYKVQSLRIRFGTLTNRMLSNIKRYEELIEIFSDKNKFPQELTGKIDSLGKTLSSVKENFSETFKPEKYIEDSAVMYIERNE